MTYTKSLWGACLKSDIVLDIIDLLILLVIVLVAKCLVVGIKEGYCELMEANSCLLTDDLSGVAID